MTTAALCTAVPEMGTKGAAAAAWRCGSGCCAGGGVVTSAPVSSLARDIMMAGTERFESGECPKQEHVDVLSERVTCVLGMNANDYTLNGTNC